MALSVIIKREVRDTVLSRRYLIYVALMFIPVGLMAWLVRVMYDSPELLARVGAAYPEPIIAVTAVLALMFFVCGFVTFPALISIIHAGNFIAGDQEKGVLLLLVSKPLQRWKIIAGKYLSFLVVFVPLILASLGLMYLLTWVIGIGQAPGGAFWGFFVWILTIVIVYTSIATLFSSMTRRPMEAILATLILFMVWITVDFIMVYLPKNIADVLSLFTISYYAQTFSSYISGGEAISLMMYNPGVVASADFWRALAVIVTLIVTLVVSSMVILHKRDIHA